MLLGGAAEGGSSYFNGPVELNYQEPNVGYGLGALHVLDSGQEIPQRRRPLGVLAENLAEVGCLNAKRSPRQMAVLPTVEASLYPLRSSRRGRGGFSFGLRKLKLPRQTGQ